MDIFKATNGIRWYISIDGETFEWCPREPVLGDKIETPVDTVPLIDTTEIAEEELSLNRAQLEERGYTISLVTAR